VWRDLNRNEIGDFFEIIITGRDVQKPKPSPEGLELALSQLGMKASEVVYIGDTNVDFETAQAAKVDFIGIPSAFGNLNSDLPCLKIQALSDLFEVFDQVKDLISLISSFLLH
jgi:phosphoglycolate phosphatase